jgi:hypothetical protein
MDASAQRRLVRAVWQTRLAVGTLSAHTDAPDGEYHRYAKSGDVSIGSWLPSDRAGFSASDLG